MKYTIRQLIVAVILLACVPLQAITIVNQTPYDLDVVTCQHVGPVRLWTPYLTLLRCRLDTPPAVLIQSGGQYNTGSDVLYVKAMPIRPAELDSFAENAQFANHQQQFNALGYMQVPMNNDIRTFSIDGYNNVRFS